MSKDYYKILEIDKSAELDEIKKSYRKLAMKYHPDKNNGDIECEDKFKECAEAFDILSDPKKRQEYDTYGQVGNSNGGSPFDMDMNDIFSKFGDFFGFNSSRKQVRKGTDIRVRVSLTIENIIKGIDKKVKYVRQVNCNSCNGYGGKDITSCTGCNGSGQRRVVQNTPFGSMQQIITCNFCQGKGQFVKTPCNSCRGIGTTPKEEIVDIQIPKGALNGMALTMPNNGNEILNGITGDLQIHIEEIPDKLFKREDINLIYEQSISVIEAILGEEVSLDTPHGNIKFTIVNGTTSGKVLRIKGKGIPDINSNQIGDLYIRVNIKIPTKISDSERDILNKLKLSNNFN